MDKKFLPRASLICLIIGFLALFAVMWVWRFLPFQKEIKGTSEAIIKAAIVPINSAIDGRIREAYVKDYQKVEQGDILFALDNRLKLSEQKVIEARLALLKQEIDVLLKKSDKRYNEAVEHKKLEYAWRLAALKQIKLEEEEQFIRAPMDGHVGEIRVHKGQYIGKGTQLTLLVGQKFWIVAHYKETQLDLFSIGKKVLIKIDAFPDATFEGIISALAPATDEEFSPSALVQSSTHFNARLKRVSARIDFEPVAKSQAEIFSNLRAGMSVSIMLRSPKDLSLEKASEKKLIDPVKGRIAE